MSATPGASVVGIGVQWGDEGKGKVFDEIMEYLFASINAIIAPPLVARFNGGSNAGHNQEIDGIHFVNHAIPSGIGYRDSPLYIGSGCVLNPPKINHEIWDIERLGFSIKPRLSISPKASLVQPHHILLDILAGGGVGTTQNGIGPCYADQAMRAFGTRIKNVTFGEYLINPTGMFEHVKANLEEFMDTHGQDLPDEEKRKINVSQLLEQFDTHTKQLGAYQCKDRHFLRKLIHNGSNVFFEGANSTLLDCVTGFPPNVTSSRTIAAGAYTGGDLSPAYHRKTIGVAKAIMSRVGNGPFVSEFGGKRSQEHCDKKDTRGKHVYFREKEAALYNPDRLIKSEDLHDIGIALRMIGHEYGASTSRPRRIGILDLVMLRDTCLSNDVNELYVTKFDSLHDFARTPLPGIPVVTAYELDGMRLTSMPSTDYELSRCTPVVEFAPKITTDISNVRNPRDLPGEAIELINFIEQKIETPIYGIGVGPQRGAFVRLK